MQHGKITQPIKQGQVVHRPSKGPKGQSLTGTALAARIAMGNAGGRPIESLSNKARRQLTSGGKLNPTNDVMPNVGKAQQERYRKQMERAQAKAQRVHVCIESEGQG